MARSREHHGPPFKHVRRLTSSRGSDLQLRRRRGLIKPVKVKLSPYKGGQKSRQRGETGKKGKGNRKQAFSLTSPILSDSDSCRLCERHVSSQGQTYRSLSFCRPPSSPCLLFLLRLTLLRSALFSRHLSVHLNFISQMTGFSVMQQLAERRGSAPLP